MFHIKHEDLKDLFLFKFLQIRLGNSKYFGPSSAILISSYSNLQVRIFYSTSGSNLVFHFINVHISG